MYQIDAIRTRQSHPVLSSAHSHIEKQLNYGSSPFMTFIAVNCLLYQLLYINFDHLCFTQTPPGIITYISIIITSEFIKLIGRALAIWQERSFGFHSTKKTKIKNVRQLTALDVLLIPNTQTTSAITIASTIFLCIVFVFEFSPLQNRKSKIKIRLHLRPCLKFLMCFTTPD